MAAPGGVCEGRVLHTKEFVNGINAVDANSAACCTSAVSFAACSRGLGIVTGCLVEGGNGVLQWVRSFVSWGGGALCA